MKFVSLALALLLAVGSHAAAMPQADAPSQLAHVRAGMDTALTHMIDALKRAGARLDGTEYSDYRDLVRQRLDTMHSELTKYRETLAPMTDSVVSTMEEATAGFRGSLATDVEELRPMYDHLKAILIRHIDDYRQRVDSILSEYMAKQTEMMEAMRPKMEPIAEELRTRIATNFEETKAAAQPIVEAVRTKGSERLEDVKAMLTPYIEEYKDQMRQAYTQASQVDLQLLRQKLEEPAMAIREKIQEVAAILMSSLSQS